MRVLNIKQAARVSGGKVPTLDGDVELVAAGTGWGAGWGASMAISNAAATGVSLGTAAPAIYGAGGAGLVTAWNTGQAIGTYAYNNSETVQNVSQAIVGAIVEFPGRVLSWFEPTTYQSDSGSFTLP